MKKKQKIGLIVLLVIAGIFFIVSSIERSHTPLEIKYFYNNPCGSCEGEKVFYDLFNREVGDIKEQMNYKITTYNVFQEDANRLFKKLCKELKVDEIKQDVPMVIVGKEVLIGDSAIEKGIRTAMIKEQGDLQVETDEGDHFIYFYTQSCKDCERTKLLFNNIEQIQNEDTKMKALDIGESDSLERLQVYFKTYKVEEKDQQVPIIFYEGGYVSGYKAIEENLQRLIDEGKLDSKIYAEKGMKIEALTYKDLPKMILVGLVNGLNPCSLSMLLFLLSLMSIGKPILKLGMTYILGKLITYLALGTVFYSVIGILSQTWFYRLTSAVNIIILCTVMLLVVINLLDYWESKHERYGKVRLQLPLKVRKFNHKVIKKIEGFIDTKYAAIGVFGVSMIVSAGEFLCTGQIYLATILYLVRRNTDINGTALLALFVYVIAMIIPLTVLVIAVSKGQKVMVCSEYIRKNMPKIKLMSAIALIILIIMMIGL